MINRFEGPGRMAEAEHVFEEMPKRDSVSWNSMMSGYFNNGLYKHTVKVFVALIWDSDSLPDPLSFSCVMKAYAVMLDLGIESWRTSCMDL